MTKLTWTTAGNLAATLEDGSTLTIQKLSNNPGFIVFHEAELLGDTRTMEEAKKLAEGFAADY